MTMLIDRYTATETASWNSFNREARNGHFLFDRAFMDYHADRFVDVSLVARNDDEIVAILPANTSGDTVHSHQGLTFGGLVTTTARTTSVLAILDAVAEHFRSAGFRKMIYKAMPHIYHRRPSEEDLYWFVCNGARMIRRDISSTIRHADTGPQSSRRRRGAAKAQKLGLRVAKSDDWSGFWTVLSNVLEERHGVAPVHSLDEIRRLASALPSNIQLHTATTSDGLLIAGVVVFLTPTVMHAQYIASNVQGRETGALDYLFQYLIAESQAAGHAFFDFGISTEDQGKSLNSGLITYKEEFGASATVHDFYELIL